MPDRSWKAFERRVAQALGGRRRGPDYRSADAGKSDVILEGWSIECKLLGVPRWGDLKAALKQSEENANDGEIPVCVVKRKNDRDADAVVAMRLESLMRLVDRCRSS